MEEMLSLKDLQTQKRKRKIHTRNTDKEQMKEILS